MHKLMSKKHFLTALFFTIGIFYALEGAWFNPLIFWVCLPLYIGYFIINGFWKKGSVTQLRKAYGFLIPSIAFSYFYHFAWFFDWGQIKTGDSTSALIFIWFPVYAVVLGFIGYLIGIVVNEAQKSAP